jgi:hypothetical protein
MSVHSGIRQLAAGNTGTGSPWRMTALAAGLDL